MLFLSDHVHRGGCKVLLGWALLSPWPSPLHWNHLQRPQTGKVSDMLIPVSGELERMGKEWTIKWKELVGGLWREGATNSQSLYAAPISFVPALNMFCSWVGERVQFRVAMTLFFLRFHNFLLLSLRGICLRYNLTNRMPFSSVINFPILIPAFQFLSSPVSASTE